MKVKDLVEALQDADPEQVVEFSFDHQTLKICAMLTGLKEKCLIFLEEK